MTDELVYLDATGLAAVIASGEVSPLEAVDATIARIERLDGRLNAVIHRTFEKARELAGSADLPAGPFRGVPMLLKDLWPSSAGDPFHLGVKGLKAAGYRHPTDSNITTAYRRAGFVITGRTNTPELGLVATTEPEAYGPTHNPWDTDRGPGGSSGGAAAAVASGMVPAANASDGGGSIRIPAAMCGLIGLKPSRGRISMGPLQDEGGVSVQHVVCHTVRDCAGILDATAGPFPGDGVIAPAPEHPYANEVGAPVEALRIGLLDHALMGDTDPDCTGAAREAARTMEELGHHVEVAHPPAMDRSEDFSSTFIALWAAGAGNSLRSIGGLIGRDLTIDDVEAGTWALAEMGASFSGVDVLAAQAESAALRRAIAGWWSDDGFDLLLTPTTARPAPLLGELTPTEDDPIRGLTNSIPYATFTSLFNSTGQPAISLPTHTSGEGLPLGIQLVAAYGREDLLIRVAAQIEAALPWAHRRPAVHASNP